MELQDIVTIIAFTTTICTCTTYIITRRAIDTLKEDICGTIEKMKENFEVKINGIMVDVAMIKKERNVKSNRP